MIEKYFKFTYVKNIDRVRVESDSSELLSLLLDVYTIPNPQFFYLSNKGIPNVDEFLSAISPTGTFKVGMFISIHKTALSLVKNDKSRILIDGETKKHIIEICKPLSGIFPEDYEIKSIDETRPIRYYQADAVKKLLKYGKGICISPTASGKSYVIGTLLTELRNNSDRIDILKEKPYFLLIVPTRQLVDQMFSDLTEYGIKDICMWTSDSGKKKDGTFKDNSCSSGFANLIITNHDWITKEFDNNSKNKNFTFPKDKIGCIFADEVHTVSHGTKIMKVVEKINPQLKFGFTGTLPSDYYKQWSIIGTFGIVIYENNIKDFQEQGFLANIEIHPIRGVVKELEHNRKLLYSIKHSQRLGDMLPDGTVIETGTAFKLENAFFEENCEELYSPMFDRISELFDFKNRNMIVLFDRIAIGKKIADVLGEKFEDNVKVHYMDGSIDVSERERIRAELENTSGNILVAQSVTASVGLNIKNLNGITFAFSGKSYVKVIQSIGRVIRLKKDKSVSKLFELYFNTRYSDAHHKEKMKIFTENYGSDSIRQISLVNI